MPTLAWACLLIGRMPTQAWAWHPASSITAVSRRREGASCVCLGMGLQMYQRQCWLLAALLAAAPPMTKSDANEGDLKRLQGKWRIVSITDNGKKQAISEVQYWTIKGKKILYSDDHDEFELDADKKPKFIDV